MRSSSATMLPSVHGTRGRLSWVTSGIESIAARSAESWLPSFDEHPATSAAAAATSPIRPAILPIISSVGVRVPGVQDTDREQGRGSWEQGTARAGKGSGNGISTVDLLPFPDPSPFPRSRGCCSLLPAPSTRSYLSRYL